MPLHSRVGTHCIIHHKVVQDFDPGGVVREAVVVLSRYLPHLREQTHSNGGSERCECDRTGQTEARHRHGETTRPSALRKANTSGKAAASGILTQGSLHFNTKIYLTLEDYGLFPITL